ncbi:phosphodiesterase [Cobetia amphilecti]|uniref:phosphodiesterase n=1 Tax=Cobetia amphilecti TaxID=1055104 RepID=UPI00244ADB74|nr:phosphodiesterase [Cobetia litoralis]MDH2420229.1 phosphodiesterase [Cobetia litoralis]MDH2422374.1 phosphodiesterase [Cobetia litoralis]
MKLIHLTDTHLVAPDKRLYGLDPRARLAAAVADINLRHGDAQGVIISGDLTDRGEPAAFQALREVLEELSMPYFLGMGNHDAREALQAAFPELPCDDGGFVQYAHAFGPGADDCVLVMLDSAVAGEHGGLLCESRLAWLDACLAAHHDRRILLALHHPPMVLGIRYMDDIRLQNSQALHDVIQRHGNVEHLLFGHVHRPASGVWRGLSFSTLPGVNHQVGLDLVSAADCLAGSHEPPAYGVLMIGQEQIVNHLHLYMDDSRRYFFHDTLEAAQSLEALDELIALQRDERIPTREREPLSNTLQAAEAAKE